MIGIQSMAAYIPRYRIERNKIVEAMGGKNIGGEKAVCNCDEDSITMGFEAFRNAAKTIIPKDIDGLLFASCSAPYKEKKSSSTIALAADLTDEAFTMDITNSVGASISALSTAFDRVKSGISKNTAVTAADCRIGIPGSDHEKLFGDGAAAVVIGNEDPIAELCGSYSINDDIHDTWRLSDDKYASMWEDRFVQLKGYQANIVRVAEGIFKKYNMKPEDFNKVVISTPDYRSIYSAAALIGIDTKSQLQEPLFSEIGYTGTAHALILLISALEKANPGDKVLLIAYGDGAQAMIFKVTDKIKEVNKEYKVLQINNKIQIDKYEQYLKIKNLIETEAARRPTLPSSASYMWREKNYFTRLHGSRCMNCETEQYPRHRICYNCKSKDNFKEIKLSHKIGKIITYTKDMLFPSIIPPHIQTVTELDGGCRLYVGMTDTEKDKVETLMEVEMVFRLLHQRSNFNHYGWKCRPVS